MRTITMVTLLLAASALAWGQAATDASGGQTQEGQQPRHMQRGPGVFGTITAIGEGKITINTADGLTAQVSTSDQTKYRKDRQPATMADFKVGDMIFVRGEPKDGVWQAQMVGERSAGAMGGNFREGLGKRFIAGEVKAINGTKLTIQRPDGQTQDITVDESTSFRKDGQSVTLADIKVGDHVFGRGEVKNDVFVPAVLNVGQPPMMGRPRDGGAGPN
jgi:outer membrane lipoprotein SlyB